MFNFILKFNAKKTYASQFFCNYIYRIQPVIYLNARKLYFLQFFNFQNFHKFCELPKIKGQIESFIMETFKEDDTVPPTENACDEASKAAEEDDFIENRISEIENGDEEENQQYDCINVLDIMNILQDDPYCANEHIFAQAFKQFIDLNPSKDSIENIIISTSNNIHILYEILIIAESRFNCNLMVHLAFSKLQRNTSIESPDIIHIIRRISKHYPQEVLHAFDLKSIMLFDYIESWKLIKNVMFFINKDLNTILEALMMSTCDGMLFTKIFSHLISRVKIEELPSSLVVSMWEKISSLNFEAKDFITDCILDISFHHIWMLQIIDVEYLIANKSKLVDRIDQIIALSDYCRTTDIWFPFVFDIIQFAILCDAEEYPSEEYDLALGDLDDEIDNYYD